MADRMQMASPTEDLILDDLSRARLQRLAERWRVPQSEVLRRALTRAEENDPLTPEERVAALHEVQRRTRDLGIDLEKWQLTMSDARR